jgi:ornithine carbamoyltransferase
METLKKQLDELKKLKFNSYGKDFLLTWEKSVDELRAVVALAELFSEMHKAGKSFRTFDTGLAISIFRDNSTRTRFSFASAANSLGLGLADLDEEKSQIAHGETVRETANMISFMATTCILARATNTCARFRPRCRRVLRRACCINGPT